MNNSKNPFRLNIGFIVKESVGYSRKFEFDYPNIQINPDLSFDNFKGFATFDRTQKGLVLQASFTGDLLASCVRCLDDFKETVTTNFTELYAFDNADTDENELTVPVKGFIDLKPVIGEYLMIDFPTKPICKANCQGLCQECGINLNHHEWDCEDVVIDPRMEKLKELLEQEKKDE